MQLFGKHQGVIRYNTDITSLLICEFNFVKWSEQISVLVHILHFYDLPIYVIYQSYIVKVLVKKKRKDLLDLHVTPSLHLEKWVINRFPPSLSVSCCGCVSPWLEIKALSLSFYCSPQCHFGLPFLPSSIRCPWDGYFYMSGVFHSNIFKIIMLIKVH